MANNLLFDYQKSLSPVEGPVFKVVAPFYSFLAGVAGDIIFDPLVYLFSKDSDPLIAAFQTLSIKP